jgi:hypothetical protein
LLKNRDLAASRIAWRFAMSLGRPAALGGKGLSDISVYYWTGEFGINNMPASINIPSPISERSSMLRMPCPALACLSGVFVVCVRA